MSNSVADTDWGDWQGQVAQIMGETMTAMARAEAADLRAALDEWDLPADCACRIDYEPGYGPGRWGLEREGDTWQLTAPRLIVVADTRQCGLLPLGEINPTRLVRTYHGDRFDIGLLHHWEAAKLPAPRTM